MFMSARIAATGKHRPPVARTRASTSSCMGRRGFTMPTGAAASRLPQVTPFFCCRICRTDCRRAWSTSGPAPSLAAARSSDACRCNGSPRLSTVASPSPAASSSCTPPCRTRSCRSSSSGLVAAAAICAMPGPASTTLARSRIHPDRTSNVVQLGRTSPCIRAVPTLCARSQPAQSSRCSARAAPACPPFALASATRIFHSSVAAIRCRSAPAMPDRLPFLSKPSKRPSVRTSWRSTTATHRLRTRRRQHAVRDGHDRLPDLGSGVALNTRGHRRSRLSGRRD